MTRVDPTLESNPVRVAAARVIVGVVGGALVYFSLPQSLEQSGWWSHVSSLPFAAGALFLVLALVAPTRWCEALIPSWI